MIYIYAPNVLHIVSEYFDTIQNILTDIEKDDGSVAIEFIDFAIRTNIIVSYAFVDLPMESDDLFRVVYCSDLYDVVCSYANKAQINSIKKAVMMSIGVGGWRSAVEDEQI